MSSTNRTRWRTQRNFSKLSLSNGSVLLGCKMPDWVLGLFCFWHHPDPWSTVMIPVFCVCLWRLLYICDIIPDPYIHFFSSLVQFRVNHQPIAGIAHRDREPFMLPFVATTYLESSVILTRMSLDCGGSHACTGRLHTKMPQRAGRFESRPFLLWGNDAVQIFSRKKDAVAETNVWVSWVVQ